MKTEHVVPWYKQFWPWFLICIPLSSFIVGGIVVSFATDGTNALVVDDYYKEGKTINERLDKIARAQALNIDALLKVDEAGFSVQFNSGAPVSGEALKLDFYHVTQPQKDFHVLLARDASGIYRASSEFSNTGKWRVRLTPMDEEWKVQQMVVLPQSLGTRLKP